MVHYTKEAENDLFEIGVYTWAEWGEDQYEQYTALLRDTVGTRDRKFAPGF